MQAQRFQRLHDVRHPLVPRQRVARPQLHFALGDRRENAVTVPLHFMQPLRSFRRKFAQARQFGLEEGVAGRRRPGAMQCGGRLGQAQARQFSGLGHGFLPGGRLPCRGLRRRGLRGLAGAARHLRVEQVVGLDVAGERVLGLDQEPRGLAFLAAAAHQVPAALEPLAEQLEAQMAFLQLGLGVARGGPDAVVELIDMTLAVAVFDVALEAGVRHGVILHLDRQPFHPRVIAGPFGHCPAFQHVTDLQAEVEMAPAGVVQLHHEDGAPVRRAGFVGGRLARLREITLALVVPQAAHGQLIGPPITGSTAPEM